MLKQKQKTKFYSLSERNGRKPNGQADKLWKLLNKFSIILIIILGVSFIATVNSLSIKGFILQSLKNKTDKLKQENENIQLNIMALESYENINKKAASLKMVKADKVDYLMVNDNLMAKK